MSRQFDDRLWDGSDPLYAPGLNWPRPNHPRWKAPAKYMRAGWAIPFVRLEGEQGDGLDLQRAQRCRELTREMLRHFNGDEERVPMGTWRWLFARYRSDEFSPLHEVKGNTRSGYLWMMGRIVDAIGDRPIGWLDFVEWSKLKLAMEKKGRSRSYIARVKTHLAILANYGVVIRAPGAADVSAMLSKLRVKKAPARSAAPTNEQVLAIIDQADAAGHLAYALGYLMQWTYTLRGVDVFGHYLPLAPGEAGGIVHEIGGRNVRRERWADGLTWADVAEDCGSFKKLISKTEDSLPEEMEFTATPEVRRRLLLARERTGGVGPVIVCKKRGRPYNLEQRSKLFAKMRTAAGLPKEIWMMDARAGAITEAKGLGADPYALRDAAQHKNITTTDSYARGRSANAARVVELRESGRALKVRGT